MVNLGFESSHLNSKLLFFTVQSTCPLRAVLTCHAIGQGLFSLTSDSSLVTKYTEEAKSHIHKHHRMLISKITLGYLLFSTRKYIGMYAYRNIYIDTYTCTVYRHTCTYTYLHTHRVDTSPIWNSAIQRPHLSGTQPRNKEVSKKGISAARLDVYITHALKLMHLTPRRNSKPPIPSLFILILHMIQTSWVK